VLPEVLTLVPRPKGNLRLTGGHEVESRHRWTRAAVAWRVVELWTVLAEPLLAAGDVGLVPWVPLAQIVSGRCPRTWPRTSARFSTNRDFGICSGPPGSARTWTPSGPHW
jgi:hypothetical protein